ncbi:BQ5605_C035g11403 [Microbotryum silenes-dioicae]|uniref:BQ5605_C035g11403 protein n=1 Tax=Microbotryum silenes-dioicae TaxID=796604 RepID=A0A2X0MJT8_9BASI|nr:BQ5605_C035g11403 [Microbotryum silenes-dioicae]
MQVLVSLSIPYKCPSKLLLYPKTIPTKSASFATSVSNKPLSSASDFIAKRSISSNPSVSAKSNKSRLVNSGRCWTSTFRSTIISTWDLKTAKFLFANGPSEKVVAERES